MTKILIEIHEPTQGRDVLQMNITKESDASSTDLENRMSLFVLRAITKSQREVAAQTGAAYSEALTVKPNAEAAA